MLQQDLRTLWGDILVLAWEGVRWLITWCHLIWEEWKKHEHRWGERAVLAWERWCRSPEPPKKAFPLAQCLGGLC